MQFVFHNELYLCLGTNSNEVAKKNHVRFQKRTLPLSGEYKQISNKKTNFIVVWMIQAFI